MGCANGGADLEMPNGKFMNRKNLLPAIQDGQFYDRRKRAPHCANGNPFWPANHLPALTERHSVAFHDASLE